MATCVPLAVTSAFILPTMVLPARLDEDTLCSYIRLLHEEGYPALEILCRPLDAALDLFCRVSKREERKLICLGLGTVTSRAAAERAVELGPEFLVSPAFSRNVLGVAVEAGIPYIPGVLTLQDVQGVLDAFEDAGLNVEILKLCPASEVDLDYVATLAACHPGIKFCPSGGVSLDNLAYWRSSPHVGAAIMGGLFVPQDALENGDWAEVRRVLKTAREIAIGSSA